VCIYRGIYYEEKQKEVVTEKKEVSRKTSLKRRGISTPVGAG
jgi:hypothetical protein